MLQIAERLGGIKFGKETEIYKFEKIKRAKAEAKRSNPNTPLIDMGVGEPDKPACEGIVKVLSNEAGKPDNRWYADNGIPEFQEAANNYLKNVFKVNDLNPYENILHGIGAKPILAMLPLCIINPGDIALVTVPGYPVTATYTKYIGGQVYNLPLLKENNFYPDFSLIPDEILKKAKLLYINYPNNPTGQVATKEFYTKVVKFAQANDIVVISDASYASITYGSGLISFLSIPGAIDVGVELHSLSKSFNMTGWRLAFIAGDPKIVKAYGTVKDNTDSGQFRAIQKAGVYALNHPEITEENCTRYSRRMDLLVSALTEVGFQIEKPKATFYCYVPCPKGTKTGERFDKAEQCADFFIKKALISTIPWDDAGQFIRFSVTFEAKDFEEEKKVMTELKNRLLKLQLVF
jgi:LL-diaminopimelate aminotransferase